MTILLLFRQRILAQHQFSITEQEIAQFTHEWDVAISHRIWTIFPR